MDLESGWEYKLSIVNHDNNYQIKLHKMRIKKYYINSRMEIETKKEKERKRDREINK